jgi:DNA/RNA-binding domain of Phe-tRNA-synthetase-like protein
VSRQRASAGRPEWDPTPSQGWVAPQLTDEFPGLGLAWVEVDAKPGKSPEPVRRRLSALSDRIYGAEAIRLRERPVPWSYRVFFRQIGLDPDRTRTPVEERIFDRLRDGGFVSRGLVADALTIAIVETGVALRAFDADRCEGRFCVREAVSGEPHPAGHGELAPGTLILADEVNPLGLLFGDTAEQFRVTRESRRVAIAAIQVGSVPQMSIEEALWMAAATVEHASG